MIFPIMTLTILNYYIVRVLHKSPDVRRHTSTKTGTVFPFEQLNFKITFFQSTFKNICLFCTSFLWMLFSLIDFNTFQLRSHKLLKVRQIRNDFFKPKFLPKNEQTNSTLLLVVLKCLFFGRKWRHQKTFWNWLTFRSKQLYNNKNFWNAFLFPCF